MLAHFFPKHMGILLLIYRVRYSSVYVAIWKLKGIYVDHATLLTKGLYRLITG